MFNLRKHLQAVVIAFVSLSAGSAQANSLLYSQPAVYFTYPGEPCCGGALSFLNTAYGSPGTVGPQFNFAFDDFQLSKTETVALVQWQGSNPYGFSSVYGIVPNDGFMITFYQDDGNHPGKLVSQTFVPGTADAFYGGALGFEDPSFTFTASVTPFVAQAGEKYWIHIDDHQPLSSVVNEWIWQESLVGDAYSNEIDSHLTLTSSQRDLAFQLYGPSGDLESNPLSPTQGFVYPGPIENFDSVIPALVTPEPGTLVLLGTGAVGLVAVLRRRLRPE